jgi:hypothetical protein
MKTFRRFLLLLAATVLTSTVRAQVINGDLNHNDVLDVTDVTLLIDGYLTNTTELISTEVDYYATKNSMIAGTWYKSVKESITFGADGTTDYAPGYTYQFLPSQGNVLFYDASGEPVSILRIVHITKDYLVVRPDASNNVVKYSATKPVQQVTSIKLSPKKLYLELDSDPVSLTATVEPSYADNTSVTWSSDNEDVAIVSAHGLVEARGIGTATITCTANDGSGVKASCDVTVRESTGTENGYVWVDLGLSVKWATMNVGANSPEEYGDYFAWGETTAKSTYNWSTYKWCKGSYDTLTKYCNNSSYGTVDNKSELDPEDDAAHVNWDGTWRMPTLAECEELVDKCTWTWTSQNGVNGRKVTGPNGNSIFLPAAGCRSDSALYTASSYGYYWSSSLNPYNDNNAYYLYFNSSDFYMGCSHRYSGRSVRAVCP